MPRAAQRLQGLWVVGVLLEQPPSSRGGSDSERPVYLVFGDAMQHRVTASNVPPPVLPGLSSPLPRRVLAPACRLPHTIALPATPSASRNATLVGGPPRVAVKANRKKCAGHKMLPCTASEYYTNPNLQLSLTSPSIPDLTVLDFQPSTDLRAVLPYNDAITL